MNQAERDCVEFDLCRAVQEAVIQQKGSFEDLSDHEAQRRFSRGLELAMKARDLFRKYQAARGESANLLGYEH